MTVQSLSISPATVGDLVDNLRQVLAAADKEAGRLMPGTPVKVTEARLLGSRNRLPHWEGRTGIFVRFTGRGNALVETPQGPIWADPTGLEII